MPVELRGLGDDIMVDILDSRGEEWKEPPKVLLPFSGSGQTLGSATATPPVPVVTTPQVTVKPIPIDENQPTTSIQIRCSDGSRLVGKFNHTHTVKDIRQFIDGSKPSKAPYYLCYSFPQKQITDESQTITAAGLVNSAIVQKLK